MELPIYSQNPEQCGHPLLGDELTNEELPKLRLKTVLRRLLKNISVVSKV